MLLLVVTTCLYTTGAVMHKVNQGIVKDTISLLCYNEPNDTRSAIELSVNCEYGEACLAVIRRENAIDDRCVCPAVPYDAEVLPRGTGSILYVKYPDVDIPGMTYSIKSYKTYFNAVKCFKQPGRRVYFEMNGNYLKWYAYHRTYLRLSVRLQ